MINGRNQHLEGLVLGSSECRKGLPTFHNDVRVILQKPLLWNEAPCLLPALQPGERWGEVRLCVLQSAPSTRRGSPE